MIVYAKHCGAHRFELRSGAHLALSDLLPEYGGEDQGPMPTELLLWSIASCFGQSMLFVAAKMKKELDGLDLEVGTSKNKATQRLESVTISIASASPVALVEKIAQLAKRYCFVTNSLAVPLECIVKAQE